MDNQTNADPSVLLRPMDIADEQQALQAHKELAKDDFEFLFDLKRGEAWPVYLGRVESLRLAVDLPEGMVPAKVIESCGGVLENVAPVPGSLVPKRRYWVKTG